MAALIKAALRSYRWFNQSGDPISSQYFLMSSPLPVIGVVAFYIYFVKNLGPKWMRNRKPFQIERIMMVYNLMQVALNSYLFSKAYVMGWGWGYGDKKRWICEPVDYSDTDFAKEVRLLTWLYLITKILDLVDTVFFVLRKKHSHISFLHLYHHSMMVLACWIGVKFVAGGHGTFLGFVNSFVHMVMYSYYFVTSVWPEYKRNIWWKKYITQLQMIQFMAIAMHNLLCLLNHDCNYPKLVCALLMPQNFFMLALFADFYRKAYLKKKSD